jgi:branched-chain amino acid transport system ATP-binding protein
MSAPLLDVTNLHVAYGQVVALRGVDLTVADGEIVAIVGANGAGKSTLLKSIAGLLAPQSGSITLDGRPIHGRPAYELVTSGVALLPEGRELFREMTVLENLHLGCWVGRRDTRVRDERIDEVFDYFPRLRERAHQRAATLSGGEAQMLGVGRALMSKPRLLLVDELSLGLAPLVVAELFEILKRANRDGMSLVIVEQFVHLALGNSDRAYVLVKGEVVTTGRSSDILADPELGAAYLGASAEAADAPARPPARTPAQRKPARSAGRPAR